MGKGKKKGGKQNEGEEEAVPSVSGLSLSETASASTAGGGDEEDGAGASSKQRRQQKKAAAAAAKAAFTVATPAPPSAAPVPEPPPPTEPAPPPPAASKKDEEEEFEGLTGGGAGGKKRRPRKKKAAGETDEPRPATAPHQTAPPLAPTHSISTPPIPIQPQPPAPAPQHHPAFPAQQHRPAFPTQQPPAQAFQQHQPSVQAFPAQRPPAQAFQQHQPPVQAFPAQQPPAQAFQQHQPPVQAFQQHQVPIRQRPPAFGQAQAQPLHRPPPDLARPPQAAHTWGQPASAPMRQPAPAPVQMPAPAPAQMPAPAPMQQPAPAPMQQPASAPVQQPASAPIQKRAPAQRPPPQTSVSAQKARPPMEAVVTDCRYKIPKKILGKSVRSTPVQVLCNYLPMNIKAITVYRYDVAVKPERPKKMTPVAFNAFLRQHFPGHLVAYDQNKIFYSAKQLPKVKSDDRFEGTVTVKDPNGREMTFEVSIKATGTVDLGTLLAYMSNGTALNPPTPAIQCMDVILRQGSLAGYVKSGRTFFRRPPNPLKLGDGLEMWTGLFQSAIFTSRPYINIDVAHKGFPIQQSMLALLEEFRVYTDRPIATTHGNGLAFLNFIKGLKVTAFLGGDRNVKREFICNELVKPANQQQFSITDPQGRTISVTVEQYFKQFKNITLRYPHLNCLWLGPRDKDIYYPLEMCEVAPNQVMNKQLNERQLSTIVKEAATPPDIRMKKIHEIIQAMEYPRNAYFQEFGLEISERFTEVKARVLQAPKIKYSDNTTFPKFGEWWMSKMLVGAQVQRWAFFAIMRNPQQVNGEGFIKMLQDCGHQMGMSVAPPMQVMYNMDLAALENNLRIAKTKKLQLVIVVVPQDRGRASVNYYSEIKKAAEHPQRSIGMLTQCVKEQTFGRMSPQTVKNLLLKINAKLTGVNHAIDTPSMPECLRQGGVMVVGADVTHPSPDQQSIPSIAAVTASMDHACSIYAIGFSIQPPKREIIVELEDMMVEHMQAYKQRNKELPRKIYVFRDGVSEGQYAQVLNGELTAMYDAYRRVSGSTTKPEVLFLVVQKRHHTRLFMPKPNDRNNVVAGTVVDTDIVHPRELDFYLVSHKAIKGTARPTRYYCICNEGQIPHDEVEQLAYYLCHLYSRCTRAVSYPAPTYYAHLACLRARALTLGERFNHEDLERQPKRLRIFDNMQNTNPMFFV